MAEGQVLQIFVVADQHLPKGHQLCLGPMVICNLAIPDYLQQAHFVIFEGHHKGAGLPSSHDERINKRTHGPQFIINPHLVHSPLECCVVVPRKWINLERKVAAVIGPNRVIDLIGVGIEDIDEWTDGLIKQFEFSAVVELKLRT